MKDRFVCLIGVAALSIGLDSPVLAQISSHTTPPPVVTAENEAWYLSGGPIAFGTSVYYPAGAIIHFQRNEMVRTGMFENTPIYARTTQEPGSVIYVPLSGGVMRPYERRRSGDLAGTSGSSAPSFRVVLPAEEAGQPFLAGMQAASPPTGVPVGTTGSVSAAPISVPPASEAAAALQPGGTAAVVLMSRPAPPVRTRIQTAQRPVGLNNVFVEFRNARWFAAGPAVEFAADRFTRVGDHQGFPVYEETGRAGVIYLSLVQGVPGLVGPYKTR